MQTGNPFRLRRETDRRTGGGRCARPRTPMEIPPQAVVCPVPCATKQQLPRRTGDNGFVKIAELGDRQPLPSYATARCFNWGFLLGFADESADPPRDGRSVGSRRDALLGSDRWDESITLLVSGGSLKFRLMLITMVVPMTPRHSISAIPLN